MKTSYKENKRKTFQKGFIYLIFGHIFDHIFGHIFDHILGHIWTLFWVTAESAFRNADKNQKKYREGSFKKARRECFVRPKNGHFVQLRGH